MNSDELISGVLTCQRCVLVGLREGYAVPAEVGSRYRRIAFMAEAPGAQEAATSRPLVGPAGQVFARMLEEVGLHREEVMLMNRIRCRPPRNKIGDYPGALVACDYWTEEELKAYDPELVVLMGATALKAVFGEKLVGAVRGKLRQTGEEHKWGSRLWTVTYHPASALPHRSPQNYRVMVQDVRQALAVLSADGT